ncbi:uncharacterized protein BKA78DRAFT_138361 [Phyllosticta capitalensis]|uniref:Uncharacterized protein n=1 Tax=Phyllosticta capitalensis TaxID=121624 RepID=A0ABR1YQB3_9PEZI
MTSKPSTRSKIVYLTVQDTDMWSEWIKIRGEEHHSQNLPDDWFLQNFCHHKDLAGALDHARRQQNEFQSNPPSLELLCSFVTDTHWMEVHQAQSRYYKLFSAIGKTSAFFAKSCIRIWYGSVSKSATRSLKEYDCLLQPELIRGLQGLHDFFGIAGGISKQLARLDLDESLTGNLATTFHAGMEQLEKVASYIEEQMLAAQGIRGMKPANDEGEARITPVGEVGPKSLLVWAIRGLLYRNMTWLPLIRGSGASVPKPFGTAKQYAALFEHMRIQAINDPKKVLVREVTFFEEHLNCLQKACAILQLTLGTLDKVLDPNSFETPDGARRAQYQLEKKAIEGVTEKLKNKEKELKEMVEDCDALISKAKIGVEIREEDHGKAIFVFTAVTTVFLPLSFITSYFGMNFADLRDTHWNQAMYWVIAGPATFVIVAITLMVAYNTDELRNSLSSANKHLVQAMTSSYSALGSFGLAMIPKLRRSSASTQESLSSSQELQSFRLSGVLGRLTTRVKAIFSKSGSESVSGSSESRETV